MRTLDGVATIQDLLELVAMATLPLPGPVKIMHVTPEEKQSY